MIKTYAVAEKPYVARHIVRCALLEIPASIVEVIELLTSEILTNAIKHGSGSPTSMMEVKGKLVRVEVCDSMMEVKGKLVRVEVCDADPKEGYGNLDAAYGLRIVDALASAWGVEGATIWFEYAIEVP